MKIEIIYRELYTALDIIMGLTYNRNKIEVFNFHISAFIFVIVKGGGGQPWFLWEHNFEIWVGHDGQDMYQ